MCNVSCVDMYLFQAADGLKEDGSQMVTKS